MFAAGALWLFAGGSIAATQVYLNPCPGGCTFTPGVNNAVTNTTPLVNSPRGIAAFAHNAAAFDAVVACADALLAPFNVTVTLIDPSPAPHIEIVIAGTAANAGFPSGVRGVAPSQCQYIPNAIAFVFANEFAPAQTEEMCWNAMSQLGSIAGLESLFHCPDVMSTLENCGPKAFRDLVMSCGASSAAPCLCGGATRNSFATMQAVFPPDEVFRDGFEAMQ